MAQIKQSIENADEDTLRETLRKLIEDLDDLDLCDECYWYVDGIIDEAHTRLRVGVQKQPSGRRKQIGKGWRS